MPLEPFGTTSATVGWHPRSQAHPELFSGRSGERLISKALSRKLKNNLKEQRRGSALSPTP